MITLPEGFNTSLFVSENVTLMVAIVGVSLIAMATKIVLFYLRKAGNVA